MKKSTLYLSFVAGGAVIGGAAADAAGATVSALMGAIAAWVRAS